MTYTNFILSAFIDQETFLPGHEVPHVFIYLHVLIGCLLPARHHPRHHDTVVNKSEVLPAWNLRDFFRLSLSTGCLEGVLLHKIQVEFQEIYFVFIKTRKCSSGIRPSLAGILPFSLHPRPALLLPRMPMTCIESLKSYLRADLHV